jgi:signal peptide peptidase SppA
MPKPRRTNLDSLLESPWALMPNTLSRIFDWGRESVHGEAPKVLALDGPHGGAVRSGSVAVIPVYGVIEHRSDWMLEMFGGTSIDGFREALAAQMADPGVRAVVLDIDSPGGTVAGMTELAAELRAQRGGSKPIIAVANSLAASAAYWLASQADEVVVSPSGAVGSVGVYAIHQEASRMLDEMGITTTIVSAGPHKTEGNEFEPLSEEARADIQARVDSSYDQFLADVAAGRRVSVDKVAADYGGGRVLNARQALAAGMVDRIGTLSQTIDRLGTTGGRRRAMAAEGDAPEILAADDLPPFGERLAALALEADTLVTHAQERSRLRAKENRPAFSTATESALRSIRTAIDDLLALDEPAQPPEPVEPVPVVAPSTPPVVAAPTYRRLSQEEWLRQLEAMSH